MDKQKLFLERAKAIHGDRYDYSLANYVKNKEKVTIICKEHGEFKQTPEKHISAKQGCPKCASNFKITQEEFIKKSSIIHNNKYDYSLVNYKNSNSDVKIICPIHGEFEQRASLHMNGTNCPKCFGRNKDNKEVIEALTSVHGDKYDYSLVNYVSEKTPIKIICREHGVFEQTYNTHKKGHGCPYCVGRNKSTKNFIEQAKNIHGDKYDYSLTKYTNSTENISIICNIHGEFVQNPSNHLQGNGCPKCKGISITQKKTKTTQQFIDFANKIHNDKYDYSEVEYVIGSKEVKIICPIHGDFYKKPDNHIQGSGCPKCSFKYDKTETEIKDFLKSLNLNIIENTREIIKPLELDIYLPEYKLAIEFDGLYWHSELNKSSNYHLNKTELCQAKGIQLIHIFEDEWLHKQDIVKSRLKNVLGLTENKIYARKTIIKEVDKTLSKKFLNLNHIQGSIGSTISLGLFYNDELVSLMTFGKGRVSMGANANQYELSRFCNKLNTNVVGGADKLLQYFIKNYNPKDIISYADRRWSQGNLYEKLKFTKSHVSRPNYWYIINNERKHRFSYRKKALIKEGYDKNKSEHQIMLDRKIYRIYDCGTIVYKKRL